MSVITYKVEFYSDWHCGSGLSIGAEADQSVLKDRNGLPIIPGKTLKGLFKDAAKTLVESGAVESDFIKEVFGLESKKSKNEEETKSTAGSAYFSNATLSGNIQKVLAGNEDKKDLLFRNISSTAIAENGQAKEHSLRTIEVCVPLVLFGTIEGLDSYKTELEQCMQLTKRLGTGRNRGLGRCDISILEGSK